MRSKHYAIGVDIGGSHISCALVDMQLMSILEDSLVYVVVDNKAEANDILKTWSLAVKQLLPRIEAGTLAGIGFAMPGPFDYARGIALFEGVPKYQKLFGMDVGAELRNRLDLDHDIPVRFINDATAFAMGESWFGMSKDMSRSMAITLGTGFGSAFLLDGIPVVKGNEVPQSGCVWHLPFLEGIADDYFSTRWFVNTCFERYNKQFPGVKEIAALSETDADLKEIFREFGHNLADCLGPWLKKFRAEVLVIGGNIGGAYALFGDSLESGLKDQHVKTIPAVSLLKENAALIGGARLLDEDYWQRVRNLLPLMS